MLPEHQGKRMVLTSTERKQKVAEWLNCPVCSVTYCCLFTVLIVMYLRMYICLSVVNNVVMELAADVGLVSIGRPV